MFGIEYHHTETSNQEIILLRTGETAQHYPWHIHANHLTIGMVVSGTAILSLRKTRHTLHRGHFFHVRPLETHSLTVTPRTVLVVFCIDIQKMGEDELRKLDVMIRGLKTSVCEEDIAEPRLVEQCHMLVSQETERHDRIGETGDPFQKIIQLLLAKPEKTFSIEQMAALAGYSQWHSLQCFRRQTGMTPHAIEAISLASTSDIRLPLPNCLNVFIPMTFSLKK